MNNNEINQLTRTIRIDVERNKNKLVEIINNKVLAKPEKNITTENIFIKGFDVDAYKVEANFLFASQKGLYPEEKKIPLKDLDLLDLIQILDEIISQEIFNEVNEFYDH